MAACAIEYNGGVVAVDSGLIRDEMAASYILECGTAVALIDAGGTRSAERIVEVLERRGHEPGDVSHVIVTHVHLDHAGGAGRLMQLLPRAHLVVHPRGARHMIDPSRLEQSARSVYGDAAFEATYGAVIPVEEERVEIMEDGDRLSVGERELEFRDTPGHARHHFCIWDPETRGWFTGDTMGLSYRCLRTDAGSFVFPTSTPVQFDPPQWLKSIDRLMAKKPQCLYPTHFGRTPDPDYAADQLRDGIRRTVTIGGQFAGSEDRTAAIQHAMAEWLIAAIRAHGVTWSEGEIAEFLTMDIELNTQGLEFWMDHG